MNTGIEMAGDVATGAILAHAVEPVHGVEGGAAQGECLNCGTLLVGTYCHSCGQSSHIHRSLIGFGHDLVHGVFHFEGKIWATLPLLFFKPGDLTRRYIHGERAKFVSPVAMFLFCAFLMFAVVGGLAGKMHLPDLTAEQKARSVGEVRAAHAENERQIAALKAQIRAEDRADRNTDALDARLDRLENDQEQVEMALAFVTGGKEGRTGQLFGFHTGWEALDHGIAAANENPNLFLYRLQSSAYKYSWMLIPISTPLVWLLFFWKRKYKFYDHLIFVTFSLIFMSLLVTALTIGSALGVSGGLIALVAMIVPPIHLYRQVRGAYLSRRSTALIRTGALLGFGIIALLIYLVILLVMGVMH